MTENYELDNFNYSELFTEYHKLNVKRGENEQPYMHFASHSHHPWPDPSYQGQNKYWEDSNKLLDNKWSLIFGQIIPSAKMIINRILGIESNYDNITLGQNTFDLLLRILSGIFTGEKTRVLASDGEYHTFNRLFNSLKERFPSIIEVVYVSSLDIDNFEENILKQLDQNNFDLIFFSHVFFKTGLKHQDLTSLVRSIRSKVSKEKTHIIIDGYHAFCAFPFSLNEIKDEIFYIAGGYKYAMSGESVCFAHCPKYSFQYKPFLSGWMSNFNGLSTFGFESRINFDDNSNPFMGSTFDSTGIYRFVNTWNVFLNKDNSSIENMHKYIKNLQNNFLDKLDKQSHDIFNSKNIIGRDNQIGNYIGFIINDTQLCQQITDLILQKNIIVDNRQNILRIGFGIYHTDQDIDRLVNVLSEI